MSFDFDQEDIQKGAMQMAEQQVDSETEDFELPETEINVGLPARAASELSASALMASPPKDTSTVVQEYEASRDSLVDLGESTYFSNVMQEVTEWEGDINARALEALILDENVDDQEKQIAIDIFRQGQKMMNPLSRFGEYKTYKMAQRMNPGMTPYLDRTLDHLQDIKGYLYDEMEENWESTGFLGKTVDFFGSAAPWNEQTAMSSIMTEVFPEESNWDDYFSSLAFGTGASDKLYDVLTSLPVDEQLERVKMLVNSLQGSSAYFGENVWIKQAVLMDLVGRYEGTIDPAELDPLELVAGVANLLDYIGLGAAVKTIFKATRLPKGTTIEALARINPDKEVQMSALSIKDPEVAFSMNVDPINAANRGLLPKPQQLLDEWYNDGALEALDTVAERIARNEKEQLKESGLLLGPNDTLNVVDRVKEMANRILGFKLSDANIGIKHLDDGDLEITAHFTPGVNKQWKTVEEVENAVHSRLGDDVQFEVVAVDKATGKTRVRVKGDNEPAKILEERIKDRIKTLAGKPLTRKQQATAKKFDRKLKKTIEGLVRKRDAAIAGVKAKGFARLSHVQERMIKNIEAEHKIAVNEAIHNNTVARASLHDEHAQLVQDLKHLQNKDYGKLSDKSKVTLGNLNAGQGTEGIGYVARVKARHTPSELDKLTLRDTDITYSAKRSWIDNLLPASSRFAEHLFASADFMVRRQVTLGKHIVSNMKMFTALGRKGRGRVVNALIEGADEGVEYSSQILRERFGLSDKEISGYKAYRNTYDLMHRLDDMRLAREAKAKGYKVANAPGKQYLGKLISGDTVKGYVDEAAGATEKYAFTVLDVATGTPKVLTKAEVDELMKHGDSFMKLDMPEFVRNQSFDVALVRKDKGATVTDVPEQGLLNKIPGYIKITWDSPWYVARTASGIRNGQKVDKAIDQTLYAAQTQKEAEEMVKRLNAEAKAKGNQEEFYFKEDRALSVEDKGLVEKELLMSQGLLKYNSRGTTGISNLEGIQAAMKNPVDSILRSINAVSKNMTIGRWTEMMKQRFMEGFDDLLPRDSKGVVRYPTAPEQINNLHNTKDPRIGKARQMWRWIDSMNNTETMTGHFLRERAIALGGWMQGKPVVGRWADEVMNSRPDPAGALKGLVFSGFISGNPIRQLWLNFAQPLFLSPLIGAKAYGEVQMLQAAMLPHIINRTFKNSRVGGMLKLEPAELANLSKKTGMDEGRVQYLLNAWIKSGLGESLDANILVRKELTKTQRDLSARGEVRVAEGVKATGSNIVAGMRKIGFDPGEYSNLLQTWLVAVIRAEQGAAKAGTKIDLNDLGTLNKISADASGLALSVTKAGKLPYQDGWLGVITQFWAIQHKAFTKMFFDKNVSAAEKKGLVLGQTAFWGAGAFGASTIWENFRDSMGLEVNPEVDAIISHGLADYFLDFAASSATGEEVDMAWAKSNAVFGLPDTIHAMYSSFMGTGYNSFFDELFGKPGMMFGRIGEAFNAANITYYRRDLNTSEKIKTAIKDFLRIPSMGKNFFQMQVGKKLEAIVNKSGDPVVEASWAEVGLRGWMGITTAKEDDYYRILAAHNNSGGKATREDADEFAKFLVDYWNRDLMERVADYDPMNPRDNKAGYAELLRQRDELLYLVGLLEPDDAYLMRLAVEKELRKRMDAKGELKSTSVLDKIIKGVTRNSTGDGIEDIKSMISNLQFKGKEKYIKYLDAAQPHVEHAEQNMYRKYD